jgi:hypothetical protein
MSVYVFGLKIVGYVGGELFPVGDQGSNWINLVSDYSIV